MHWEHIACWSGGFQQIPQTGRLSGYRIAQRASTCCRWQHLFAVICCPEKATLFFHKSQSRSTKPVLELNYALRRLAAAEAAEAPVWPADRSLQRDWSDRPGPGSAPTLQSVRGPGRVRGGQRSASAAAACSSPDTVHRRRNRLN